MVDKPKTIFIRLAETDPLYIALCAYAGPRGWSASRAADYLLRMTALSVVIAGDEQVASSSRPE